MARTNDEPNDEHEHPGGDQPHAHGEGDAVATHDSSSRDTAGHAEGERRMQLREEELQARKQPVEAGQVEIRKELVTEQRTLDVPIMREEVTIERHPVARRPADQPLSETGETIRVPVREEQVSVEKRPVVAEEIEVGKRQVQESRQVSGTVRREEARIEGEGDVTTERGHGR